MPRLRAISAAITLIGLALPAGATPIVPVSQDRTVSASATSPLNPPSSASFSAPDFAPFVQQASASSCCLFPISNASASQNSTIGGTQIGGNLTADGTNSGQASSVFDVTFDVTETVAYQLTTSGFGVNEVGSASQISATFVFSGPGGVISQASGTTLVVPHPDGVLT